jgi:hypothetical protein
MLVADDVRRARDDRPPGRRHVGEVDEPVGGIVLVLVLVRVVGRERVPEYEAPPDVQVPVEREVFVERPAGDVVRPPERLRVALDRDHVHGPRRRLLEPAQVVGDQAERAGDRDHRVVQRFHQRADQVARGLDTRIDEDDDGRRRPADPGIQGRGVAEAVAGPDDLDRDPGCPRLVGLDRQQRLRLVVGRAVGDHHDLSPVGRAVGERSNGTREVRWPVGRDQHDRRDPDRRLVQPGRHRGAGPVAHDPVRLDVRRRGPLERVQRGRVDHLPAGCFDLHAQRVRGRPVPGATGGGARVGERADLGGRLVTGHRGEDTGRRSRDRRRRRGSRRQLPPSGLISAFLPLNATKIRSVIPKVVSSRPRVGCHAALRRIENRLPSIARWKVSATIRAPTPFSRPLFSSASRRM